MNLPRQLFVYFLLSVAMHQAIAQQTIADVRAMQQDPLTYAVIKADQKITIDGRADEPIWNKALWSSNFEDITGTKSIKPTFKTQMKMLWDDQCLYIYAEMEEPHIWADIKKHDEIIYHNNDFEVFIKPFAHHDTYYEIEVNPLNTIFDLLMTKPYRFNGEALIHWDLKGLKTAVNHRGTLNNPNDIDQYWTVEIAIPFQSALPFGQGKAPKINSNWQINFSRVQWEHEIENGVYQRRKKQGKILEENNWVWSPIGIVNMHYPERWGYIQFVDSPQKDIALLSAYHIKKLAWNIHYLQKLYFDKKKKYASSLEELTGYREFISENIKEYEFDILLNKQLTFYQLTLKNKSTKEIYVIDNKGNSH